MKKLLLALVCLSVAGAVQAGIWKCKNAKTGRIEYSDISCHGDSYDGNTVEATPNVLDSSGARQQAAITLQRKAQEDYQDHLEASRSATSRTGAGRSSVRSATGPDSVSCKAAKRAYESASRQANTPGNVRQSLNKAVWDACTEDVDNSILRNPATTSRVRLNTSGSGSTSAGGVTGGPVPVPSAVNPTPTITSCDSAGCWDSNGRRYDNGGGNGQTMFRSDGKVCTNIGTGYQCN